MTIEGLRGRCARNTETSTVKIPWPRRQCAGVRVFVLCCVPGRNTEQAVECRMWRHCVPARQFSKCVRGSIVERRVANAEARVRFPPSAPIFKHGRRQLAQSGLQNPTRSGQHRPTVPILGGTCAGVARLFRNQSVVGATPTVSSRLPVAQIIERRTSKARVAGESPAGETSFVSIVG